MRFLNRQHLQAVMASLRERGLLKPIRKVIGRIADKIPGTSANKLKVSLQDFNKFTILRKQPTYNIGELLNFGGRGIKKTVDGPWIKGGDLKKFNLTFTTDTMTPYTDVLKKFNPNLLKINEKLKLRAAKARINDRFYQRIFQQNRSAIESLPQSHLTLITQTKSLPIRWDDSPIETMNPLTTIKFSRNKNLFPGNWGSEGVKGGFTTHAKFNHNDPSGRPVIYVWSGGDIGNAFESLDIAKSSLTKLFTGGKKLRVRPVYGASLVHEMGHALDMRASGNRLTQAFYEATQDEWPVTQYSRTNAAEYFAEMYAMYASPHGRVLQQKVAPKAYVFMKQVFDIQNDADMIKLYKKYIPRKGRYG